MSAAREKILQDIRDGPDHGVSRGKLIGKSKAKETALDDLLEEGLVTSEPFRNTFRYSLAEGVSSETEDDSVPEAAVDPEPEMAPEPEPADEPEPSVELGSESEPKGRKRKRDKAPKPQRNKGKRDSVKPALPPATSGLPGLEARMSKLEGRFAKVEHKIMEMMTPMTLSLEDKDRIADLQKAFMHLDQRIKDMERNKLDPIALLPTPTPMTPTRRGKEKRKTARLASDGLPTPPPEPVRSSLPTVEDRNLGSSIDTQRRIFQEEHPGSIMSIPLLYYQLKKDNPFLELAELHRQLRHMSKAGLIDLEVAKGTVEDTFLGIPSMDGLLYYIVWK